MIAAAALAALAAFAGLAAAGELIWPQEGQGRRMLLAEEAVEFHAVGRLNVGGARFCTATLISEREALTAAHCLYHPRTGALAPLGEMRLALGHRGRGNAGERGVLRAARPESFALVNDDAPAPADLDDDIALLELDAPVDAVTATPFPVGPLLQSDPPPIIVSYARDRAQAPSINDACPPLGMVEGVLVVACAVERGVSGAPVLAGEGRGARVVGVVSAMGRLPGGEQFALAALAAPWLETLRADLAAQAAEASE